MRVLLLCGALFVLLYIAYSQSINTVSFKQSIEEAEPTIIHSEQVNITGNKLPEQTLVNGKKIVEPANVNQAVLISPNTEETSELAENTDKFISPNSQEFEAIYTEYINNEERIVSIGDDLYFPYQTELGIEFFQANLKRIMEFDDNYPEVLEQSIGKVNRQQAGNGENEQAVLALFREFNSQKLNLLQLHCSKKLCIGQLNALDTNFDEVVKFYEFVKTKRVQCGCKYFGYFAQSVKEALVRFDFD